MKYIQQKYIQLLSINFRNFKRKGQDLYNFSCPFCGDSKKNRKKARGYLIGDRKGYRYFCHNCNAGFSFNNFLKFIDVGSYHRYVKEAFFDNKDCSNEEDPPKTKQEKNIAEFEDIIFPVSENNEVLEYLEKRKIYKREGLFYTSDLRALAMKLNNERYDKVEFSSGIFVVLVIFDLRKNLLGFVCRDIKAKNYIILKKDEEDVLIFNIENVNFGKTLYVVEAPFDSLFLPNCIAVLGLNKSKITEDLFSKDKTVIVFDNQPRNRYVVSTIKFYIENGWKVAILENEKQTKTDINDMVKEMNMSKEDILKEINKNTFQGIQAKLKLATWSRVNG